MKKRRVLITGGRSPSGLTISRMFASNSYDVINIENLKLTLADVSNSSIYGLKISSPLMNLEKYKNEILSIIKKYNIDIIFPVCEEVFYLAYIKKDLDKLCDVFCDNIDKLDKLHNKWEFYKIAQTAGFNTPKSILILKEGDISNAIKEIKNKIILKPIYSRFGSSTKIIDSSIDLLKTQIKIEENNPYIAQEVIEGKNLSTYSVFKNGLLIAHSTYSSEYNFGLGTLVYFSPVKNYTLQKKIEKFGKDLNLNGQFGFDFIQNEKDELYILECNPRTTNGGISLFENQPVEFIKRVEGKENTILIPNTKKIPMLGSAMIIYLFAKIRSWNSLKKWIKDYKNGKNIIFKWKDPLPSLALPIIMLLLPFEALKNKFKINEMFSSGIRYNGEFHLHKIYADSTIPLS